MSVYISPCSIVNKNIFESIQDIAICPICTCVVIDPLQCSKCENCFCSSCITIWLENNFTCPFKCTDYTAKEPSRVIKNILNRVIFNCPKNCKAQITYEDISSHIKNCTNASRICPTCGTEVNENLIERGNIRDLKIENELLKIKIAELEKSSDLCNEMNRLEVKEEGHNNTINTSSSSSKYNKRKQKADLSMNIKENSLVENKGHIDTYESHHNNAKVIYNYPCCNRSYDCTDCHNKNANHPATTPDGLICRNCEHFSSNVDDVVCVFCSASFAYPLETKIEVIKFKSRRDKAHQHFKNPKAMQISIAGESPNITKQKIKGSSKMLK